MNLKEKIEKKIRMHMISLVIDLAGLGLSLGLTLGAGLGGAWLILFLPLTVMSAYGLLANAERIYSGRKILRSPLFYLMAVQHDLSGQP